MQIFGSKICPVVPSQRISFQMKLAEIFDLFQRSEDWTRKDAAKINFAVRAVIEPKFDSMAGDMLRVDDV